jgi:release factor glutamine methyltransferase
MPGGHPSTIREAISHAVTILSQAGVPSSRVDAELLAAYVLGVPRSRLAMVTSFDAAQAVRFHRLIKARASRVPLQHLTGTAPFRGLDLAVGPGVFIPRPETELLVEWAITRAGPAPLVVDLGSGSGAIALSFAVERPNSQVYALERAPAALVWLRRNVAEIDPRVRVVEGDLADPTVLTDLDGRADLVLCNPPYVPAGAPVDVEVAEHDPAEAVFGGADGLALIPAVVELAARLLRPGGWVGVEHDDGHGVTVPALLRRRFVDVSDHTDLAGRPRFAVGRLAD